MTSLAYLLDTDWIIDWFSGHPGVGRRLREIRGEGLAISVVSLAELYEGVHYSREPAHAGRQLSQFLGDVTLIGVDRETCDMFGQERGRLRAAGTLIGDFDLLIGVTAVRHDLTLLTNNRRHFALIAGLRIESRQ
ncbi:MAG: type II toxin-antitoxin system VapC family toxin [Candidatus Rokubacteria bacterium]|nr:type II toxin-antitoxin system VapC family toxin [Candidatus Rokubacteria bacterium]